MILALLSFSFLFFNSALYGYSLLCVANIYTDLKKNHLLIASGLTVSIGLSK